MNNMTFKHFHIWVAIILFGCATTCRPAMADSQPYEIIIAKDISTVAMTKRASEYAPGDMSTLPRNTRKKYKIVVSQNISKKDLKDTFRRLVIIETAKNPDIDEIVVYAYNNKADVDGAWTMGKMTWSPGGNWTGVTPYIASTNDRSGYKFLYELSDNIGKSTSHRPTAREMKIYRAYDKALWADVNVDEDVVARKVAKRFNITTDELNRIFIEVQAYRM